MKRNPLPFAQEETKILIEAMPPLKIDHINGSYFVYSEAFQIMAYGVTKKQAIKNFQISLEAFIMHSMVKDKYETEMKRLGWKKIEGQWKWKNKNNRSS